MGGKRFFNALRFAPSIAMLALASGIIVQTVGGDIVSGIKSLRTEKTIEDNNEETSFELSSLEDIVKITTDIIKDIPTPENEQNSEIADDAISNDVETLPVEVEAEEVEEENIEEPEIEEETIVPQISDELLTSGYEFKNIDFAEQKEINNDIDAWIEIQGTNIDYPIMYAPDKDNPETGDYYYLHHDRYGNESSSGEPFLYSGNKSLNNDQENISPVSLLYAHHMRHGKMFAQIFNYVNQSYYDEHPFAVIYTPDGYAFKVSFFAGIITGPKTSESIDVSTEELFNEYVTYIRENSTFESDIDVNFGDKLMILNTCEYTGGENSKYLLYGIVEKQYTNELQIGNNDENKNRRLR